MFTGLSLLGAVLLASRQSVIKIPKRKAAPPTAPADLPAPADSTAT